MTTQIGLRKKEVEIEGSSKKSWQDEAQAGIKKYKKLGDALPPSVSKINKKMVRVKPLMKGLEVQNMTAKVDPNTGNITQYQVCMKLVYRIKRLL